MANGFGHPHSHQYLCIAADSYVRSKYSNHCTDLVQYASVTRLAFTQIYIFLLI